MRVAAAAAVVMGCGAKPPEALPPVQTEPQAAPVAAVPQDEPIVKVARPDLPDVAALIPDLTEQLRWPLTVMEHPALEPHYPVARDLAVAGISWTELCARGVQNRRDPSHKDELAYLNGWCLAEAHDTAGAVHALVPLQHSSNLVLGSAVPFDLVNVLVADVDFSHADQLLGGENVRDPLVWDLLAAAYFEVGKNVDSYQASWIAAQLDANARMEQRCHRIARLAMLGSVGQKLVFETELADAANAKIPDPTCVDLALRVPCALYPGSRCEPYFKSQHYVPMRAVLLTVYEDWPGDATPSGWIDYAWKARHAWPADGSLDLVNAALDAAVGTSNCDPHALANALRAADAMGLDVVAIRSKADEIRKLSDDPRACREFHDRWVVTHP